MTARAPVLASSAGLWMLMLLAGGCGLDDEATSDASAGQSVRAAPSEETLPPVVLPDLSGVAAGVRAQVRERYAALQALGRGGSVSARERAGAHGALGLILMAAEYYAAAAVAYEHAQAIAPDDARWPYYLGQLHRIKGEPALAARFFERAVELRPSDVAALVWLGQARLDQGRPDAAAPLFDHAVLLAPGSAAALAGVGHVALARRDHLRAIEYLERALATEPGAASLHYPLAMAYRASGDVAQTEAHLRAPGGAEPTLDDPLMEAYENVLETPLAFERRGVRALAESDWAGAAEFFRRGLELAPENASLRHRLATAMVIGGDTRGAVAELEETLRRSPGFARAYFSLGAILDLSGRSREAVDMFTAALTFKSDYLEARIGLAEALRVTGRLEEALTQYEQVVAVDPGFSEMWVAGADTLIRLGRYQDTRAWLTEARQVLPDEPALAQIDETIEALLAVRRSVGR